MARRILSIFLALAFVAVSFNSEAKKSETGGDEKKQVKFSLPTLSGKMMNQDNLRGKVVFITFFASWCKPCEKEVPHLNKLQAKNRRDLKIIGVGYDVKDAKKLAKTAKDFGVKYEVLVDKRGLLKKSFNVQSLPYGILIDDQGIEIKRYRGISPKSLKDLERKIARQIAIIKDARSGKKIYFVDAFEETSKKAKDAGLGGIASGKIKEALRQRNIKQVSNKDQATVIIIGSVSKIGPVAGLEVRFVEKRSGGVIDSFTHSVMKDDWAPFIDRLIGKLEEIK